MSNASLASGNNSRAPVTVTYTTPLSLSGAANFQIYRIVATGNLTLSIPTGHTDGGNMEIWVQASGVTVSLVLNGFIVIPSQSSFTNPHSIPNGKKAKLLLQYDGNLNGGQWELTSFIQNY